MTSILVKIEAVLDSEVGHGYCGIEENINPSICRINQTMAKIEPKDDITIDTDDIDKQIAILNKRFAKKVDSLRKADDERIV